MNLDIIKSYFIGLAVFLIGLFFSVNLGEFFDSGSIENARSNIITIAILFLAGTVAVSASLIINEIRKKKS